MADGSRRAAVAGAAAIGLWLGGCGPGRADLTASGRVHAANGDTDMVVVGPPTVVAEGNNMLVKGTVTRRPGFDGPVPGRLVVTVTAADGKTELDEFTTGWSPPAVPTDGDRTSTYAVRYGLVPPDGSTVRVEHEPHPDDPRASFNSQSGNGPRYERNQGQANRVRNGLGGVNTRVNRAGGASNQRR